ncbi:MAG: hypothetical protein H6835_07860 [Planctomycetes bacterium]|nr:hypothetical protein [Planctomycetota bacterium]
MVARALIDIGTHLRLVALGMECGHGVGLAHQEIQRAVDDARPDESGAVDVSPKRYLFREAGGVRIEGWVEEHEPGTIWLAVDGHRQLERDLPRHRRSELADGAVRGERSS